jgi:hypothetical protein
LQKNQHYCCHCHSRNCKCSILTASVCILNNLIPLANVDVWIYDLVWMMRLKEHLFDLFTMAYGIGFLKKLYYLSCLNCSRPSVVLILLQRSKCKYRKWEIASSPQVVVIFLVINLVKNVGTNVVMNLMINVVTASLQLQWSHFDMCMVYIPS